MKQVVPNTEYSRAVTFKVADLRPHLDELTGDLTLTVPALEVPLFSNEVIAILTETVGEPAMERILDDAAETIYKGQVVALLTKRVR